jgi:CAAX protease family protein
MNESGVIGIPAAALRPPAPIEPLARRTLRWVDIALIILLFILLEMVLAPGFARAVYDLMNHANLSMDRYPLPVLIQLIVQEGIILLVIACFTLLRGLSLADLGIRKTPFFWVLVGFGLLLVVFPVRLCAGLIAHFALGGTIENIAGVDDGTGFPIIASPALAGLPSAFMVGVVAPVVEELIFRAILYVKLRQRMGMIGAALISSLLFGLIHPYVAMGVSAVVMGLALAWLYEKSRSIWVPLTLHIVNNSVLFLFLVLAVGLQDIFTQSPGF